MMSLKKKNNLTNNSRNIPEYSILSFSIDKNECTYRYKKSCTNYSLEIAARFVYRQSIVVPFQKFLKRFSSQMIENLFDVRLQIKRVSWDM